MAVVSTINWSPQIKELNLFSLPFLMPDYQAIDALTRGEVGREIFKILAGKDVIPLAWGENGFGELSNSERPVRAPSDFLPLFVPVAENFSWDLIWFGVLMTYNIVLGQFTPPMAVNLMVSCRLAGCSIESTVRWDVWLLLSMFAGLILIILFPPLAIWLPKALGFM